MCYNENPIFVDHTYRIYLKKDDVKSTDNSPMSESFQLFPRQLHAMISDANNQDIVGWMPHGRSWKIFDKERVGELLQEYFGCDSLKRFLVSVNVWGFKVRLWDLHLPFEDVPSVNATADCSLTHFLSHDLLVYLSNSVSTIPAPITRAGIMICSSAVILSYVSS